MKKYFLGIILVSTFLASLTACSPSLSPSVYNGGQVGVASQTVSGVIISKRAVQVVNPSGEYNWVGAIGGATAGSALGGGFRAPILGGLAGGILGHIVTKEIDKSINTHSGFEYLIRVSKGKIISVTQTTEVDLAVGQHVTVILGDPVRVIPS